jgi:hypothetical protein
MISPLFYLLRKDIGSVKINSLHPRPREYHRQAGGGNPGSASAHRAEGIPVETVLSIQASRSQQNRPQRWRGAKNGIGNENARERDA